MDLILNDTFEAQTVILSVIKNNEQLLKPSYFHTLNILKCWFIWFRLYMLGFCPRTNFNKTKLAQSWIQTL